MRLPRPIIPNPALTRIEVTFPMTRTVSRALDLTTFLEGNLTRRVSATTTPPPLEISTDLTSLAVFAAAKIVADQQASSHTIRGRQAMLGNMVSPQVQVCSRLLEGLGGCITLKSITIRIGGSSSSTGRFINRLHMDLCKRNESDPTLWVKGMREVRGCARIVATREFGV